MNKTKLLIFSILAIFIIAFSISSVSANDVSHENSTALEDTFLSKENDMNLAFDESQEITGLTDENTISSSQITKVKIDAKPLTVKYSSNKIKYTFKVYNATNNKPIEGVDFYLDVSYEDPVSGVIEIPYTGTSASDGSCSVNIKSLKAGTYDIYINAYSPDDDDGDSPFFKATTLKVQADYTITAPETTVTYKANKYFKITVKKGSNPLKNLNLKLKVYTGNSAKTYTVKTNKNGVATFSTKNLKVGTHKVVITSGNSKYKFSKTSQITVKGKNSYKVATIKLREDYHEYTSKKLPTGDTLLAACSSRDGQYSKGIYIGTQISPSQELDKNTRLLKAKVYLRNVNTGKTITKTLTNAYYGFNIKPLKWIDGYEPYKAQVWYKHR